jgi:hypothetical protein
LRANARRRPGSFARRVAPMLRRHHPDGHLFPGWYCSLFRVLRHDDQRMYLFAKRLQRGRFVWPSRWRSSAICLEESTGEYRS